MSYRDEHNPDEIVAAVHRITERARRREHRYAVAAAIFAVIAVIASVTAWYQLTESRRVAERDMSVHDRLDRAVDTLDRVLTETATAMRAAGDDPAPARLAEGLSRAQAYFVTFLEHETLAGDDEQRRYAELFIQLSTGYLALGASQRAVQAAGQAREILEALGSGAPDDRNQIAASLVAEGDARMALGETAAAVSAYGEAVALREGLSEAEPADGGLSSDLGLAYERHGQALARLGEADHARERFEQAVATREALTTTQPEDAAGREALAVAYSNLGDHELASGRPEPAAQAYRHALGIYEGLLDDDAGHDAWQASRALYIARVGRAQAAAGAVAAGLEALDEAADHYRELVTRNPHNIRQQARLAEMLEWAGGIRFEERDLPGARAAYTQSLEIRRQLHEGDPDRPDFARGFADSLARLAEVDRAENLDEMARLRIAEAISLRRAILERESGGPHAAAELARVLAIAADYGLDPENHLRQALDILHEISDADPLAEDHVLLAEDIRQRLAGFTQ